MIGKYQQHYEYINSHYPIAM